MKKVGLFGIFVILFLLVSAAWSGVPAKISYEGRLTDSSGNPITTAKTIEFRIYGSASAGTALWGPESISITPDSQGVFSVVLGSSTAIPSTVFNTPTTFLELTVAGETLTPRTQLVSVGYSFKSASAQSVEDGAITNASIANATIANSKVATNQFVKKVVGGSGVTVSGDEGAGTGIVTITAVSTAGGTVSQVSTGTGLAGGPITATGIISLEVPVAAIHGGTGLTSYTTGDMLYASGTNTLAKLPAGTNGQVLKVSSGLPAWGSTGGTGTVTQVDTGKGLTGGPITSGGTISIDAIVVTTSDAQTLTNKTISDSNNTITLTAGTIPNLDASKITTGTIATARLGSGTASSSTFLRGDQTWVTPGGSGTVTSVGSARGLTGGPITSSGSLSIDATVVVTTSDAQTLTNKTLTTPTIASFANAGHNHQNATGGGALDAAAIGSGTVATARLGSGTASSSTFLRGDQTWSSAGTGTVTQVNTGNGLTGGPVTTTGTIAIDTNTVITTNDAQALTNKTISGASNTLSSIADTSLNTISTAGKVSGSAITSGTIAGTTAWNGAKIAEIYGGTNQLTYTTGDILYSSASNTLSKLPIGTAGQVLKVSGGIPAWGSGGGTGTVTLVDTSRGLLGGPITSTGVLTIDTTVVVTTSDAQTLTNKTLTTPVISTISNTGTITLPTATDTLVARATTDTLTNKTISGASNTLTNLGITNLTIASEAQGDIIYRNASNWTRLPAGTAGQVLQTGGAGANPAWGNASTGTVTSISQARGIFLSPNPITSTGSISIDALVVVTTSDAQTLTNKTISGASNTLSSIADTSLNTISTAGKVSGSAITSGTIAGTTAWNGAKIAEIYGGTNQLTYTTGDILYSSASNTLSKLPIGTAGQVLKVSGGIPAWGSGGGTGTVTQVDTSRGLLGGPITSTGVLTIDATVVVTTSDAQTLTNKTLTSPIISTISNTGTITLPTATDTLVARATTDTLTNKTISGASNTLTSLGITNLTIASEAQGDIIYRNASNWTRLPAGTAGQVLQTGGAGANPAWGNASAGTVTSISQARGIFLSPNPITSTGSISVDALVVVTTSDAQTLTNKTISGASNTLSSIADTSLNTISTAGKVSGSAITSGTIAGTTAWNGAKIAEIYGGTNQSTYTTGDILYSSASNTLSKLPIGTAGQVLKVSGGIPAWGSGGGTGTVTQVDTGNGLTGGPVTTTGIIAIDTNTVITTNDAQTLVNKTLTTPTIASFTNAGHDHSNAAGGGQISHLNLTNIGTNTHAQIDTHIGASIGVHGATGAVVGTSDAQTLTNKTISGASNTLTNLGITNLTIASQAQGDIIYHNGTNWTRLAAGTSGQFLKTNGTGANPAWADSAGSGTVTSISQSTGITLTPNPITTTGTVGIDNTVVATLSDTQTLTNKTISGASNTINNLNASNLSSGTVSAARLPAGTILLLNADETDSSGAAATDPIKSYVVAANTYSSIVVESEIGLVQTGTGDGNWNFIIDYGGVAKETIPIRAKGNNANDSHSLSGSIKYSEAFTTGGIVKIYNTATSVSGTWHVRSFRVYGII